MRVQLAVSVSGTRDGKRWPEKGAVVDLPDVEAKALVAAGIAVAAPEAAHQVEAAVTDNSAVEKAVTKTKPARKPRAPRKSD